MPRTLYQERLKEMANRDKPLIALIRGEMKASGIEAAELSDRMKLKGLGFATLYHRFKEPDKFTIRELRSISKALGIPLQEMFQKIQ